MVRQGWLDRSDSPPDRDIRITPKAVPPARRGSRPDLPDRPAPWDGRFDLLVLDAAAARGTGSGSPPTSPSSATARSTSNLGRHPAGRGRRRLLDEAGVRYERFTAAHAAGTPGAAALVRRAWDLREIGQRLRAFVAEQRPLLAASPRAAATRTRTRPGSGWCTPGVLSSSGTPTAPALLPGAWPGTPRRRSSTGTRPACGRPPTGTSSSCLDAAAGRPTEGTLTVTEPLLVDRTDGVVTLTLNRADVAELARHRR